MAIVTAATKRVIGHYTVHNHLTCVNKPVIRVMWQKSLVSAVNTSFSCAVMSLVSTVSTPPPRINSHDARHSCQQSPVCHTCHSVVNSRHTGQSCQQSSHQSIVSTVDKSRRVARISWRRVYSKKNLHPSPTQLGGLRSAASCSNGIWGGALTDSDFVHFRQKRKHHGAIWNHFLNNLWLFKRR